MYKWLSMSTGELCETFGQVLKVSVEQLFKYHILPKWSYKKGGW